MSHQNNGTGQNTGLGTGNTGNTGKNIGLSTGQNTGLNIGQNADQKAGANNFLSFKEYFNKEDSRKPSNEHNTRAGSMEHQKIPQKEFYVSNYIQSNA